MGILVFGNLVPNGGVFLVRTMRGAMASLVLLNMSPVAGRPDECANVQVCALAGSSSTTAAVVCEAVGLTIVDPAR
jgi:hypothetical protein